MTAASSIVAGSRIFASEIQQVAPLAAYKGANQSIASNSTTLTNDSALFVPMVANAIYVMDLQLFFSGNTAGSGDLKFSFTGPSGFTMNYQLIGGNGAGGTPTDGFARTQASTPPAFGTAGAGTTLGATLTGSVVTSSTPGTLQFQWCQANSNAVATIVQAGSYLAMWQIQ